MHSNLSETQEMADNNVMKSIFFLIFNSENHFLTQYKLMTSSKCVLKV